MNIAYFLDIAVGLGGAGNLLLKHAALMSKLHRVTVVIPTDEDGAPNKEYAARCRRENVRYVGLHYNTSYNFEMIDFATNMESSKAIEEFAVREKIDFFHSVQLNVAVEYVSRKLCIPHLMSIYQLREEEFKICGADIYPHYHLCDSLLYSERWKNQLGIESRCIRPVAALDEMKLKEICGKGKLKLLMLGDVASRKNQLAAIKAVEKANAVTDGNIELHIAGENSGIYAKECIQYVNEKSLNQAVIFHGFVSDIKLLLKDSDCLLCSSTDESFPSSIVEALTYDLTIISTPVAGVPELFLDRENAFVSRDYSEDAIAASILECIEYYKNGRIREIHVKAKETWNENFDRKIVMNQLNVYYSEIKNKQVFQSITLFETLREDIARIDALLGTIDDLGEEWIHRKLYYYLAVQRVLKKGKMYIWGAGKWGKIAIGILHALCPNVEIVAFIDNNKCGNVGIIPIKRFDEVEYSNEFLYSVSFCKGRENATQCLQDKGLKFYSNIWNLP